MSIRWIAFLLIPFFLFAKVYDCFPFFNEVEQLKIRLSELDDVVDVFVLVEATKTFQGKDKELLFEKNKQEFKPFLKKIVHVVVEDMPEGKNHWVRDYHQRNSIMRGLKDAKENDLILIGDVDEIPKNAVIAQIKKTGKMGERYVLGNRYFWGYLNKWAQKIPRFRKWDKTNPEVPEWPGTIVVFFKDLKQHSPEALRGIRKRDPSYKVIWNAGWHFSWQGGVDRIITKVESYAHTEYNNAWKKNPQNIKKSLENKEPFLKDGSDEGLFVPIDDSFPKYIRDNQAYFEELGWIKKID
ncbi:MAG: hypothetical protein K940chlam8_00763 [Chlamydiae bacterium]|nr:hypothetical protein [Chlamydiota bacterium]